MPRVMFQEVKGATTRVEVDKRLGRKSMVERVEGTLEEEEEEWSSCCREARQRRTQHESRAAGLMNTANT